MSNKAKPLPMDIIREALELDPTGKTGLRWREKLNGKPAGSEFDDGFGKKYFRVKINGRSYFAHRIAYALAYGVDALDSHLDHIDGNGKNNHPKNLRLATHAENMRNRGKQRNNAIGKKGVSWHKKSGKWTAQIVIHGRKTYLGIFDSVDDASAAYEAAAREHFGEFYREGATA